MRRLLFAALVLVAAVVALVWAGELGIGPVVITREGEQKLVLQFGNPRLVITQPGLDLRVPLVETVRRFDARQLYFDSETQLVQTQDEERLVVDHYVIWRIGDPLLFYKSFPGTRADAEAQIDRTVRADVRSVIGRHELDEVVTGRRVEIMQTITRESAEQLREFGLGIVDVRISRTELPPGTEANVFARMRAERERLARKYRAEGEEKAREIRARGDRRARVLVAEARREASTLRGEGDAKAARIYAEAYEPNAAFYSFVRSLEAYRKTIGSRTTLILPPEHEFFQILGQGLQQLEPPGTPPASPPTASEAPEAPPPPDTGGR